MDKSGSVKAAVIGVGGFLGMGEHLVAVPYDKIKFVDRAGRLYRRVECAGCNRYGTARVDHDDRRGRQHTPPATASKPNPGIRTTPCSTRPRTS